MLPAQYEWLRQEPGPKMILEGLKLYGTRETAGDGDNPVILEWAKEVAAVSDAHAKGVKDYRHDKIPWCGLFVAVVALRAGKDFPDFPLWARNWAGFGARAPVPGLGDVLVFTRGTGGHVALYVGEDDTAFHVLGGNQGDAVSIVRIEKDRLLAARRPLYRVEPPNVRPVRLASSGAVSENEA